MAEEQVTGQVQGPNGERLSLQLGSKSFAVTSRDLISVLLVVVMGIGFYLTVESLTDRLDRGAHNQDLGFQKLEKLLEVGHQHQKEMLDALQGTREATGGRLQEQNTLLHAQTSVFEGKITALEKYIEGWFSEVGRRLELLNWNIANPDKALPLRATPPPDERQPERGRPER